MKRLAFLRRALLGKTFLSILGVVLLLYVLLFTPWGNLLLQPLLEERLSALSETTITVRELSLRHNKFHIVCTDPVSNTFSAHGGFSLLTLRMYGHYDLHFSELNGTNPLPLAWKTSGALSGGIAAFDIMGRASIKEGAVQYRLQLHRFKLSTLDLTVNRLPISPFMNLMHYPTNTDSALYAQLHMSGIDKRDITGELSIKTDTTRFTPSALIEEDSNESFNLRKFLADENGIVKPFKIDLITNVSLDELGILEQLSGIHLRGKGDLNGFIRGDNKYLALHAHSTLAQSSTKATVIINNLEPYHVTLHVQHADLGELFHLVSLNSPLEGNLDIHTDLTQNGGLIDLHLMNALTIPKVFKDDYNLTQPSIRFNASVTADLSDKGVHYKGVLKSNLTRMEIDKTTTHGQMLRELLDIPNRGK